jgi:transcription initiation factor IIE alpha subunit
MSIIGYTSGGSPIFSSGPTKSHRVSREKTLYECSADTRHKLTKNQASSKGYMCSHCGAPLKVREQKIKELEKLAKSLGANIVW